jgi:hypothetical protein
MVNQEIQERKEHPGLQDPLEQTAPQGQTELQDQLDYRDL